MTKKLTKSHLICSVAFAALTAFAFTCPCTATGAAKNPEADKVYDDIMAGKLSRGQQDNSLRIINNALRFDPNNIKYIFVKAQLLSALEEEEQAIPLWDKLVQLAPTDAVYWDQRANSWMALKNYPEAQRSAENAVKYSPLNMNYRLTLSRVLESEGRWPQAEKVLDDLLQRMPTNDIARNERCSKVERRMHEWQKVIDDNTILLRHGSVVSTSDRLCGRAEAYYELGRYKDAIQDLKQAEKLLPDDMRIQVQLLAVYQKLGDAKTIAAQRKKVELIQNDFKPFK